MNRADINKRLKRTNIKGRDYIEVNQRILAFWELYPNGPRFTTAITCLQQATASSFRARAW